MKVRSSAIIVSFETNFFFLLTDQLRAHRGSLAHRISIDDQSREIRHVGRTSTPASLVP